MGVRRWTGALPYQLICKPAKRSIWRSRTQLYGAPIIAKNRVGTTWPTHKVRSEDPGRTGSPASMEIRIQELIAYLGWCYKCI